MKASERFTKITNKTGLYNIQAIDNVPSIMQRGLLSNEKARNITHVSIAMNEVQSIRDHVVIPDGLKLHQYCIPYYYVMCAAVVNEKAAVRLKGAGFDKKIFIKSDEFF